MTFIVIDGMDGSGKSTQGKNILEFLKKRNKSVCFRVHPEQDNFFGVMARYFLCCRGKGAHCAAAVFYMLDVLRSILVFKLKNFDYVVFVRYLMGTAYLPYPLYVFAYRFFSLIVPRPRVKFFLDVSVDVALFRIAQSRRDLEMFENLDSLRGVSLRALFLAFLDDWVIINSNLPEEGVYDRIIEVLFSLDAC